MSAGDDDEEMMLSESVRVSDLGKNADLLDLELTRDRNLSLSKDHKN